MTKRSTKQQLLLSAISLLLCVSMLVGSTFAWFTDSVTSTNNVIKSGNLDVELYYQAEGQTDWTKVTDTTNVFKENALWEPGHTEVVKLKVVNEGSLALKYQLGVNVASEVGSVNVNDEAFKLSDFIKFGIVDGAQTYTRDQAIAAVDATATPLKTAYNSAVTALDAKNDTDSDEKTVTMVVYMPTSVGNEANYKKDAAKPTINLGINLFATQQIAESDSFGPDYDAGARFEVVPEDVTSANNDMNLSVGFEWALRTALAKSGVTVGDNETLSYNHLQKVNGKLDLSDLEVGATITAGNTAVDTGYASTAYVNKLTEDEKKLFDGFTVPWALSSLAYGLINVTELDLSNTGIKYIPSQFLIGNPSIEKITLPETVVAIGYSGTLEDSTLGWGYNSLSWMKSLKSINMPSSLKYIADYSFAESPSLELNIETIPALTASGRKIFRVVDCLNAGYMTESKVTGDVGIFAEKNKNAELGDFIFEGTAVTGNASDLEDNQLTFRSTFGNIKGITGTLTLDDERTLTNWMFDGWSIDTLNIYCDKVAPAEYTFANNTKLTTVNIYGGEDAKSNGATLKILINSAANGATVNVSSGSYDIDQTTYTSPVNGNLTYGLLINKSLTLKGAYAGISASDSTRGTSETVLMTTTGNYNSGLVFIAKYDIDVTIDGITFNSSAWDTVGMDDPGVRNANIVNNIFNMSGENTSPIKLKLETGNISNNVFNGTNSGYAIRINPIDTRDASWNNAANGAKPASFNIDIKIFGNDFTGCTLKDTTRGLVDINTGDVIGTVSLDGNVFASSATCYAIRNRSNTVTVTSKNDTNASGNTNGNVVFS